MEGCVYSGAVVTLRVSWQIARAMKFFRLLEDQTLPIPQREAWDFFSDPGNLPRITPPWLGFEVTSEPPPRMYPGMVLTYRVRPLLGIPVSWMTEITQVSEPDYFIDEQRFGPYRLWHHEHRFETAAGGTRVIDTVHYALPAGPLSPLVDRLIVRRQLANIFGYRRRVLEERFGKPSSQQFDNPR